MKPIYFKEATQELKKPASMSDEECGSLFVHQGADGICISLWRAPFWERVKFLFHGRICLGVLSGKTQPPVWLDCKKTVFVKDDVREINELIDRDKEMNPYRDTNTYIERQ